MVWVFFFLFSSQNANAYGSPTSSNETPSGIRDQEQGPRF